MKEESINWHVQIDMHIPYQFQQRQVLFDTSEKTTSQLTNFVEIFAPVPVQLLSLLFT